MTWRIVTPRLSAREQSLLYASARILTDATAVGGFTALFGLFWDFLATC